MGITKEQAMAYTEVIEILKYMPEEDINKIPQDVINYYKNNMDVSYQFKVDEEKAFEEQEISEKAKIVLALLFRDYWATEEQKNKISQKEKQDIEEEEKKKREKYNPDKIFKEKIKNEEYEDNQTTALVEYKKENWFGKFLNFMKKFFNKK